MSSPDGSILTTLVFGDVLIDDKPTIADWAGPVGDTLSSTGHTIAQLRGRE
jgi:hypothetical protein